MSELTSPIRIDIPGVGSIESADLYLKSEADKVIAELKAQKAQAEDDCAYWKTMAQKNAEDNAVMAKQRAEALERGQHHEYKRCLANAEACKHKRWRNDEGFDFARSNRQMMKWLELADKFKE